MTQESSAEVSRVLPQLRIDELLDELQGRLEGVRSSRDRVRKLLDAVVGIGSSLDLEQALTRIVAGPPTRRTRHTRHEGAQRRSGPGRGPLTRHKRRAAPSISPSVACTCSPLRTSTSPASTRSLMISWRPRSVLNPRPTMPLPGVPSVIPAAGPIGQRGQRRRVPGGLPDSAELC